MGTSRIKPDEFLIQEIDVLEIKELDKMAFIKRELNKRGWTTFTGKVETFFDYDTLGTYIRYFPTKHDLLMKKFSLE